MPGLFIYEKRYMHPAIKIILLIYLAIMIQFAHSWLLLSIAILVPGIALALYAALFMRMLKRSRWLLLTLTMIYALTTPGEFVQGWPIGIAPSYEGISSGLQQAARLVIMLAGLALLLGSTRRETLMAGIYALLQPTRILGGTPERFTARMWLTLHYVERAPSRNMHFDPAVWAVAGEPGAGNVEEKISLPMPKFHIGDGLIMSLLAMSVLGWLL
jgi:energy-coupling factor transporter transmembrane protein EcfT